ncbi:MAG: phytanoyl-CoA dioxygenase family protein [Microcoleus sp.]
MIELTSSKINIEKLERHFYQYGWIVVQLPNPDPVYAARASLLAELRRLTGSDRITLEDYHEVIRDDKTHTELQFQLTQFFWSQKLASKVITAQLDLFKAFLGQDLNIQSKPHLRITRPGKPQDNIGYHRDTYYGCSPFELSVLVPYTDVPPESALSVLSGSHIRPESDFSLTQIENPEVSKGSVKHQLGFLYAPKLIDPSCTADMQPVPLAVGEALIFSLATVHGSVENRGLVCRWSSDIRVVNGLAPLNPSLKAGYYEKLSRSVVSETAEAYNNAQLASLKGME